MVSWLFEVLIEAPLASAAAWFILAALQIYRDRWHTWTEAFFLFCCFFAGLRLSHSGNLPGVHPHVFDRGNSEPVSTLPDRAEEQQNPCATGGRPHGDVHPGPGPGPLDERDPRADGQPKFSSPSLDPVDLRRRERLLHPLSDRPGANLGGDSDVPGPPLFDQGGVPDVPRWHVDRGENEAGRDDNRPRSVRRHPRRHPEFHAHLVPDPPR